MQSRRRKAAGIAPPQLPRDLRTSEGEIPGLSNGGALTRVALGHADWSNQQADDFLFEQVQCRRVLLTGVEVRAAQILDARFDGCDLANSSWEKAHLKRVEIVGSRLMGMKLLNAEVEDVLIKDCSGEYALFWSSNFKGARFENCMPRDASFADANLNGVVFAKCDLRGANFQGASLAGADLRGSQLDGLRVGVKELQGAIIDPSQVAGVVGLLGITVKWD